MDLDLDRDRDRAVAGPTRLPDDEPHIAIRKAVATGRGPTPSRYGACRTVKGRFSAPKRACVHGAPGAGSAGWLVYCWPGAWARRTLCRTRFLPAHAEVVEVGPALFGEPVGTLPYVVEPGAELDHHALVSAALSARQRVLRLPVSACLRGTCRCLPGRGTGVPPRD